MFVDLSSFDEDEIDYGNRDPSRVGVSVVTTREA